MMFERRLVRAFWDKPHWLELNKASQAIYEASPHRNVVEYGLQPATNGAVQKQLARIYVVSLLHIVVLCNGVEVTQPPLER